MAARLVWLLLLTGCSMKSLIYPVPGVQVGDPPLSYEEVDLTISGGIQIVGWHLPARDGESRPAMVFFHGNGENLETMKWAGLFEDLAALGVPLLVVDYPGYGRSGGSPSEIALKSAAEESLVWLAERYPERSLIPCGWSLGAALAIHLAASRPAQVEGLVAMSPWTSLADVATAHFPDWLVRLGLREKYDSLSASRAITSPTLVLHGTRDEIIPMEQGRQLASHIESSRWVAVQGAGHNDLLSHPEVWSELEAFIAAQGGSPRI